MLGTINNNFKPNLIKKFSRVKYIMHWLSSFFLRE